MNERVVITSPRTRAARPFTVAREIDDQSRLGRLYMASLIKHQFRLGIAVTASLCGALFALPALFATVPAFGAVQVFGIGLEWILLGGGVYPVILGVGWVYVRLSERGERRFAELVDKS